MSFNSYKKDFYTSPRHLSILRESPEDMFLNGERSEDVYVNFEDRSIINNSCSSFVKPLPPRPSKPPPPLPNSASTFIQPIHPPIPTRVSSNLVTMVTASTQTMNNATRVESNVPDILAFTLNNQTNIDNSMNLHSPSYQFSEGFGFKKSSNEYEGLNNSEMHYPQDDLMSNNVHFGAFIAKYNNMMHDAVSWTIVNANLDENSECDSQLDISRFELRRNAEKEFYQLLNDHIDVTMREYYLSVFAAIQQIRNYCETLRVIAQYHNLTELNNYLDYEPGEATCNLMKMSFNENYRRIICSLGGLEALAQLVVINNSVLGDRANNYHLTVRRYACMALTNLTFGISENKALLCSIPPVLTTLASFLSSYSEEVKQVAASVIRNLSWKADDDIKLRLREVNVSKLLTYESMKCAKESCLKSLLSALWNISAHSKENKIDICEVNGALAYFVDILNFKTIALVENSGGILRNVSSVISTNENYRNILRQNNAYQILLKQLRSSSLTIVGNACGTLCNLSVECIEDQQLLWDLGAVGMLKNLAHSKHRTISTGSAATLKNLLSARASLNIAEHTLINALKSNSTSSSNTPDSSPRILSPSPSLHVRKLNALESDIENILRNHQSVSITSDKSTHDLYSVDSPMVNRQSINNCNQQHNPDSQIASFNNNISNIKRSGSDESMVSAHSDLTFDKANFQSLNTKLKNASISLSKSGNQPGYLMSLSGYSNSSGHYDLTLEQCMKISNFSSDIDGPNSSQDRIILDNNSNNNVLKKRNFHSYPDDYDSDNSEKPLDYSRQFGDTDEYMVYPTSLISNHNDQIPVTTQTNVFRNIINIPPPSIKEKPKVYATEGTPVQCGSRMSPLSEEAIEDDVSNGFNTIPVLLEESCYPVSKKPDLEKIEERATSEMRENYPSNFVSTDNSALKLNKSVKFGSEPPHIIQDTPLMFSRSSSVGSLDSFDTHSFHSSVQSEYSRRTSEVVSPSELPDSPGSETESKSPTKSIHKTMLTKSRNSISPTYSSSLSMDDNNSSTGNGPNNAAILQECIQSGMPYSKQSEKLCKSLKTADKYLDNCETTVSYAIEGTPFNYSTKASSLSNISIPDPLEIKDGSDNSGKEQSSSSSDSEEQSELLSEIIQSAMPKGLNANTTLTLVHPSGNYIQPDGVSVSNTNCSTFITMSAMQYNSCYPAVVPHKSNKPQVENNADANLVKFPQFYYCDIDSPKQYGVEGTPNSLSQRDSICSETNLMIKVSSDIYSKPLGAPPKPPKRTTSTLSSVPEKSSILNLREENVSAINEELHVYMTENTPADYSRASPVSHSLIADNPLVCDYDKQVIKDIGAVQESKSNNDDKSSLSSLSIESAGMERTLLQQCISSAMPVPKLKQLTVYGRRSHSSDNHTSKIKYQLQTDSNFNRSSNINIESCETNSFNTNAKCPIDTSVPLINENDSQSKFRRMKSPSTGIPTSSKSKLREPKKSFIPTPKQSLSAAESVSSSKPSSEKSLPSDIKSKSNCSLKSVLGYNSCMSSTKSNKKLPKSKSDQNESDKDYKTKSEQSINCSFLVNGFDVNQSGLAASKSDIENVSPILNHDESQYSEISIDNNTYSIKDSIINDATKSNQPDLLSETDTLELVEINELLDDDFLKDMSSSMEIDAAFCRNPVSQDYGPGQFTDDDFTYDDFIETANEPSKSSSKTYEDLMKDGAQAVLASLNFMSVDENDQNSKGNTSSLTMIPQSDSSESIHMEINVSSSASSLNNYSQKKGPKIVKPISIVKSNLPNPNSLGIRGGGRKSITGIKVPTTTPSIKVAKHPTQVNVEKPVTYLKKTPQSNGSSMVSNKLKIQPINKKSNASTSKTNSNESINENVKITTKLTKPIAIVNSNIMLNSFDQKPSNTNSKIPGLSSSVELKINSHLKIDKPVKIQKQNVRIPKSNENRNKIESLSNNNNNTIESNEYRNDDVSEGVWIIRNELCPDTVCIK